MVSWFSGIMSGAVDKLELTSLSSQVIKVKSQNTSKMNFLRKAIDMFEEGEEGEAWSGGGKRCFHMCDSCQGCP